MKDSVHNPAECKAGLHGGGAFHRGKTVHDDAGQAEDSKQATSNKPLSVSQIPPRLFTNRADSSHTQDGAPLILHRTMPDQSVN